MHHVDPLASFIIQAMLIITSARLIGWLARSVGQPIVIAEVTAGILLGPSLLGRVAPEAFHFVFPSSTLPVLQMMSHAGLLFFMFLIGLELDPRLLRGLGPAAVGTSAAGIIVPFGLALLVAPKLFPMLAPVATAPGAFALFLGVAMSVTAFPVLARILAERKLVRTRLGSLALACAAVDDVAAWCLLALAATVARSGNLFAAARTTLLALGYVLVMLMFVRPLLVRLSARITTRAGLTQNIVAVTFVLILVSGFTTERIGIHALFGGFLLGAVMPREGGFAQALAERLEDFVVVFLLPLFFAFSGLRTELGLLHTRADWLLCGLIILIACLGKFGGAFVAARFAKMSYREASAIGVLMNTRGLMELVVLNVGLDLGVITPKAFTMLVIMALVTTFITTPLLALFYPSAAQVSIASKRADANAPNALLLCVADARVGPGMVILASHLDAGLRKHRIIALHLEKPPERTSNYLREGETLTPREQGLAPLLATAATLPIVVEPITFVSTNAAKDICRVAGESRAEWVLLGLHRPTLSKHVFGGIVHDVLDESSADVCMIIDRGLGSLSRPSTPSKAAALPELRRVLVGYQSDAEDGAALGFVSKLLEAQNSQATLLAVHPSGTVQAGVRASQTPRSPRIEELRRQHGVRLEIQHIEHDDPVSAILAAAPNYDLVVLGFSKSWGFAHRRLGFQPDRLVVECPTSMVIVHGRGRKPLPSSA